MAKIQIQLFVDVEVDEENGCSLNALKEGFEIIKLSLQKDERIKNAYYEGISRIY